MAHWEKAHWDKAHWDIARWDKAHLDTGTRRTGRRRTGIWRTWRRRAWNKAHWDKAHWDEVPPLARVLSPSFDARSSLALVRVPRSSPLSSAFLTHPRPLLFRVLSPSRPQQAEAPAPYKEPHRWSAAADDATTRWVQARRLKIVGQEKGGLLLYAYDGYSPTAVRPCTPCVPPCRAPFLGPHSRPIRMLRCAVHSRAAWRP